jgi:hypothetical protein
MKKAGMSLIALWTVLQRLVLRPGIDLTHAGGGNFDPHHQSLHDCYVKKSALDQLCLSTKKVQFLGGIIQRSSECLRGIIVYGGSYSAKSNVGTNQKLFEKSFISIRIGEICPASAANQWRPATGPQGLYFVISRHAEIASVRLHLVELT